jgi:SH3 domain-containing YSC84-like protein 1
MEAAKLMTSLAVVALFLCVLPTSVVAQSAYAGWIEEIHGPAFWRPKAEAKEEQLHSPQDQYRRLHVGEGFRCGRRSTLRLRIYGHLVDVSKRAEWYEIPEDTRGPDAEPYGTPGGREASLTPGDVQTAIEVYARLAAHSYDGFQFVITSPPKDSRIFADRAEFRWEAGPALGKLRLAIEDRQGKLLWHESDVPGIKGELTSEAARRALKEYRDEGGQDPLRFVLAGEGFTASVTFSVLSVEQEQTLAKSLAQWDQTSGVLRHVGRASVFDKYMLLPEAAAEYDAAIKAAPGSHDLWEARFGAHSLAGDPSLYGSHIVSMGTADNASASILPKGDFEYVARAGQVLGEILDIPDDIPKDLLDKARCVVVIPSVQKAASAPGASYNRGVMTCRTGEQFAGAWGAPTTIVLEGGSFGRQLGGQATDFVLLVMNARSANAILNNKIKLGADAAAAAGPKGRDNTYASNDMTLRAEMLVYSRSRGLFGGVSLEGSTLRLDNGSNEKLYGKKFTAADIVRKGVVPAPESAGQLLSVLNKNSPGTE